MGITLLELLENRNPFHGMQRDKMLTSKVRHDFIPASLAVWIQDLVSKATHPTPELRFQSMQEFLEAIESKHVSYIFERSRIQAHALATKAEKFLAQKRVATSAKCITQALHICPDCVSALIAGGRHNLFIHHIPEAKEQFDKALLLNPRANIQKELGWLCLESENYPQAISLLTDHLQRNAADYEAFNLLLECFYRTERYEIGFQVAKLMVDTGTPSSCFLNNYLLFAALQSAADQEAILKVIENGKTGTPFLGYNINALRIVPPEKLKSVLLFENYRFGLPSKRQNVVTIENNGKRREFAEQLISVGRSTENSLCFGDTNVSRWHCVIVNVYDDVWIYDLDSTLGMTVDGIRVDRKAYLDGVCTVKIGSTTIRVCPKAGLLL
ncbi:MAG: FHA domain-containing protein [Terracidiphilus sp.]